jgi:hypothetical protein
MNVNGYETKAAALRALRTKGHKFVGLLAAPESNPKVFKNMKSGVMTSPLHLAPASVSGWNVCPQASKGCIAACLHTAGNPAYMTQKFNSRNDKTAAYMTARPEFMALLVLEIAALERKAARADMACGVRLNATSDIAWERVAATIDGEKFPNVMAAFPEITFYDYTKVTKRALAFANGDSRWPENYHLTFSKAEDNDADVIRVLEAGGNVAAVFESDLYKAAVIRGFHQFGDVLSTVIDGDKTDFRPMDGIGVLVALKAKGDAKQDTSGFVVRGVA